MRPNRIAYWVYAFALLLAACAPEKPPLQLQRSAFTELPGWESSDVTASFATFRKSCLVLNKLKDTDSIGQGILRGSSGIWKEVCAKSERTAPPKAFFEQYFLPFRIMDGPHAAQGLYTGYYEPELRGAKARSKRYFVPVYGLPYEHVKGFSRAEIESGALEGCAPIIAWVDDPVDFFFLQIQGSGRIRFEDGGTMMIGYAGQNGFGYKALGKVLIDRGEIAREKVSMFSIKDWLRKHKNEAPFVMWENPSYIYMRTLESKSPLGAQGVPLTPGYSLAVDPSYIPYGMPVMLNTTLPETDHHAAMPFSRLMIAQDTGGAIKGTARGDIFFGPGTQAEAWAGNMKAPGESYLLIPNALAAQLP